MTTAVGGASGQFQAPVVLPSGVRAPGIHWMGGLVDFGAGLDDVEKRKFLTLPGLELRHLGRPGRNSRYADYAAYSLS
jgi:hypothetical protein